MPSPSLRVVIQDHGTQEQCWGTCCLGPLQAFRVKCTRVRVVENVDPVLLKVHFDPVVCCSPGEQTVMIIVGGYCNDFAFRLVSAHGLPTEFAQVVCDLHRSEEHTS